MTSIKDLNCSIRKVKRCTSLFSYLLWLFSVYPSLFLDLLPAPICIFHTAILVVESPLIFQTKSQCRDKNTCYSGMYWSHSFLCLSLSRCSDFFHLFSANKNLSVDAFYILSCTPIFLSVPLPALPWRQTSLPTGTLLCATLSLYLQLFAKDKTAFLFSNFVSQPQHLKTTVPMKNTRTVSLKGCSTFPKLLKKILSET